MMDTGEPQLEHTAAAPGLMPARPWHVDLGPADSIPLGQGRSFVVGERTVAVFRQRDGRLYATDNRCPHRGGPLAEGVVGDGKVICPLHAWTFDLSSGRCLGGDTTAVRVYEVRLVNGRLLLRLED